jgi:hypothetical protein
MATVGVMTRTIAQATGVPERTVAMVVRELRTTGLLTTGARGVNAPAMTPLDAARVLIALLVSDRPVDAPKIVKDFGQLKCPYHWPERKSLLLQGVDLPGGHLFEEGLAAIIKAIADMPERHLWALDPQAVRLATQRGYDAIHPPYIVVCAELNDFSCFIRFDEPPTYRYFSQNMENILQKIRDMSKFDEADLEQFNRTRVRYLKSEIQVRREFDAKILVLISADFIGD